jgi:hypothetical protein
VGRRVESVGYAEPGAGRSQAVLLSNVALEPLRRIEHRRDLWTRVALCEQLGRRPVARARSRRRSTSTIRYARAAYFYTRHFFTRVPSERTR